jgi:hypothetical protein
MAIPGLFQPLPLFLQRLPKNGFVEPQALAVEYRLT